MAAGSVPFDSVSLLLCLIDIWSDIDICMLSIVIYCHELFSYLIYHLIMILSGRRGLDCDIVYTADLLCYCCIVIGYGCLIGTFPSTQCRSCIWLRESFHIHGCRICFVRLCVVVAFWYALWFLLLGVSSLCCVWMQIRARDWWTDRESMEGEDL